MESFNLDTYVFERRRGGPPTTQGLHTIDTVLNIWQLVFTKNYEDCVKSIEELKDVKYTNRNLYIKSREYFSQEEDKISKEWEIKNPRKIFFTKNNGEIPYEELGLVFFENKVYRKMDNGMPDPSITYSNPRKYEPTPVELYNEIKKLRNELHELRKEPTSEELYIQIQELRDELHELRKDKLLYIQIQELKNELHELRKDTTPEELYIEIKKLRNELHELRKEKLS